MNETTAAAALAALRAPVFVLDADGTVRETNDAAPRAAGDDLAETLVGTTPDGVGRAVRSAHDGDGARFDALLLTDDGRREPHEFEVTPLADGGAVVTGRPASDHRAALDRMTDAFFTLDEEWRVTYANDPALSVLGAAMGVDVDDPAELVGRPLWGAIPDAVGTRFYEGYHEAVETGEPVSFEAKYDPLDSWFDVRAYPDDGGLSVFLRDVTERRTQEQALERRARTLRRMHDVIADRSRSFEGQVRALLELGTETLDTSYGALARTDGDDWVGEVVHPSDGELADGTQLALSETVCERTATTADTVVAGDLPHDHPELASRSAVVERGFACYLGAPVEVDGDVYGTFCFYGEGTRDAFDDWEVSLVDVMSRWVGGELERQRQNERLERFASFVSHDLRGPLSVLRGRIDLAEETGDPEQFAACRDAVGRINTIVDDLLALTRAGDGPEEREPVALDAAARAAWESVESAGSLVVETDRTVSADPGPLDQLLANLFRNAIEHGSTGGQTSSDDAPERAAVTVEVGDTSDGFYVADDGPGIPPDEREVVFERGYTTDREGTGLGLAIVEEVARAHGWTVQVVESAAGGARVEVRGV